MTALAACACSSQKSAPAETTEQQPAVEAPENMIVGGETRPGANYMPKGRIYRTTVPCADLVPVTLNGERTALVSFPAVTDVGTWSTPLHLADGWLLDRRGITPNSAFTRYTYTEYAALKQTPTPAELMAAIMPEARVADIVELPYTTSVAVSDTAAVNKLIREGLPGCRTLYTIPKL